MICVMESTHKFGMESTHDLLSKSQGRCKISIDLVCLL